MMPKRVALSLVSVLFLAAAPVFAALKLARFDGTVSIKTAAGVVTVKPGDPVPVIPPGAEVVVVSGKASFYSHGVVIDAPAGAAFKYGEGKGGVQVAATAGTVSVGAGKSVAAVGPGSAVAVSAGRKGVTISVTAGSVPITTDGKTETVAAGYFVTVAPAKDSVKPAAPESLPAPAAMTPHSSPAQETDESNVAACVNTVSPSAPCE